MKVTEENYETVEKALKERCAIPKEFQRKDALEAMIVFIKRGRARDVKHAMWIIRNEFPYMLQ
ncbi:hypothetical protein ACA29_02830 [Lederbergia galactosidilytica]|uniref:Uncharacterized protein n=1 Tax=Lederbergia galactosidilytica TaxID=217031 RepID=A0A0Q9YJY5_9BACI|nr:hypothetical protein ACA29_02830 [Lederbergia galactosidilytica]